MSRNTRVTSPLVIVLAAVALVACDGADRVSGSRADSREPRFSRGAAGELLRPALSSAGRFRGGADEGTIDGRGEVIFVDVEVPLAGGARAGRHTLYVAPGAVAQATVFTMKGMDEEFAYVVLNATSARRGARANDVGVRGFRVPLKLCLDGTDAVAGEDKIVAFFTGGGAAVALRPVADPEAAAYAHRVCGEVRHFSGYIIAAN